VTAATAVTSASMPSSMPASVATSLCPSNSRGEQQRRDGHGRRSHAIKHFAEHNGTPFDTAFIPE